MCRDKSQLVICSKRLHLTVNGVMRLDCVGDGKDLVIHLHDVDVQFFHIIEAGKHASSVEPFPPMAKETVQDLEPATWLFP